LQRTLERIAKNLSAFQWLQKHFELIKKHTGKQQLKTAIKNSN